MKAEESQPVCFSELHTLQMCCYSLWQISFYLPFLLWLPQALSTVLILELSQVLTIIQSQLTVLLERTHIYLKLYTLSIASLHQDTTWGHGIKSVKHQKIVKNGHHDPLNRSVMPRNVLYLSTYSPETPNISTLLYHETKKQAGKLSTLVVC